jgi:hypothetical protein
VICTPWSSAWLPPQTFNKNERIKRCQDWNQLFLDLDIDRHTIYYIYSYSRNRIDINVDIGLGLV